MLANNRLLRKIIGAKLTIIILVSIALYSLASLYISVTIVKTAYFYQEEKLSVDGYPVLTIYSGSGSLPITSTFPRKTLSKIMKVEGVIKCWGEVTTPALVNGSLLVIRGIPPDKLDVLKIKIIRGERISGKDITGAIVSEELAKNQGLHVGDVLLVDPLFSKSTALIKIKGIFKASAPFKWEIIVSNITGKALRGTDRYSVIRIIYDPEKINIGKLAEALGVKYLNQRILFTQALLLVSKGLVKGVSEEAIQSYYLSRMGLPVTYLFSLALASGALLSLLTIALAWVIFELRSKAFAILIETGRTKRYLKTMVFIYTLPIVILGVILGGIGALLLPGSSILGYPIRYTINYEIIVPHMLIVVFLYGVGVATAEVRV